MLTEAVDIPDQFLAEGQCTIAQSGKDGVAVSRDYTKSEIESVVNRYLEPTHSAAFSNIHNMLLKNGCFFLRLRVSHIIHSVVNCAVKFSQ